METVSKGEFAGRIGVSPGRVSQYIAAGHLSGEAIVGEGRSARIAVDVALQQLSTRLHHDQRYGANGVIARAKAQPQSSEDPAAMLMTLPPPAAAPQPPRAPTAPPIAADPDAPRTVDQQIAADKAAQSAMRTRQMARDEALAVGVYVRTDDHRRLVGEMASRVMQAIEGSVPDMAEALAAEFHLPPRAVTHALRRALRAARAKAAAAVRDTAAGLAADVDDLIEPAHIS